VWAPVRTTSGPAARQALLATVPVSLGLFVALITWRYWLIARAG